MPICLFPRRAVLGVATTLPLLFACRQGERSPAATHQNAEEAAPIDREALVARHQVELTSIDPQAPVMVGNGNLAMALDITGLQTFRGQYSEHSPLLTMAQWGWHAFPNPRGYTIEDAMKPIEAHRETYRYPYMDDWSEADANPAIGYLRENPHRFSLGRLSFIDPAAGDAALVFGDIGETEQTLDLWTGTANSTFAYKGEPVAVTTQVHPDQDEVIVTVTSPLLAEGDLAVALGFPYVSQALNPDPSEWNAPQAHQTTMETREGRVVFNRTLDETTYVAALELTGAAAEELEPHHFAIRPSSDTLRFTLTYAADRQSLPEARDPEAASASAKQRWADFWQEGGVVDFSGSTDPRAAELERRVVLSQYLTAVNTGGEFIPQEEGLYSNSWNGKFHHEMHTWHVAHFLLWNRQDHVEGSLDWYNRTLTKAQDRAAHYRREGAWWPKMTGPDAVESPSTINPFIMWQQPHPIYLAELAYRNDPRPETLERFRDVVFATADLLASYPIEGEGDTLIVGPPIVAVQEVYDVRTTTHPAFEAAYFAWGLRTAQQWRARLGMDADAGWQETLDRLAPLPVAGDLYLPVASLPEFWSEIDRPACAGGQGTEGGLDAAGAAPDQSCLNRDHPSFLMATGLIPGDMVDDDRMRRTMSTMDRLWDFRQTWGWDFPMMAMTAARLGEPEKAVDYLMMDAANNHYGVTGMTPRYHLGADGYTKNADTYFPSNGSLLTAVSLMAAGWDGAPGDAPGFPDGWSVRHEDINPLP